MTLPRLTVDLTAVERNVRLIRDGSAAPGLIAVVKANGFGHGATQVAGAAVRAGATALGVTSLREAAPLLGVGVPVLSWLNPVSAPFDDPTLVAVEVAVPSLDHLESIVRGAQLSGQQRAVHLFVDTGMSRDGCPPSDWLALCMRAREAEQRGHVSVVGVMGHLGEADDEANPFHRAAVERYMRALRVARGVGLRPRLRHLSATSAALRTPRAHLDALRVGAGLVGIDPVGVQVGGQIGGSPSLRPAATLSAPVVQVRRVGAGQAVGYGHDHRTDRPTWLGLLPLGYADGVPRRASGRASVMVRGQRRPLVGWVSMDQVVVDLGDDPVTTGEEAILFGPGDEGEPTLRDWAVWGETIEHEIVTGIGARVERCHRVGTGVAAA